MSGFTGEYEQRKYGNVTDFTDSALLSEREDLTGKLHVFEENGLKETERYQDVARLALHVDFEISQRGLEMPDSVQELEEASSTLPQSVK